MRTRFITDYDPKNAPIKFVKVRWSSVAGSLPERVYRSTGDGRYEIHGNYKRGYQAGWRWDVYDVLKRNAQGEPLHLGLNGYGYGHLTLGDAIYFLHRRIARGIHEGFEVFEKWRRDIAVAEADTRRVRERSAYLAQLVTAFIQKHGYVDHAYADRLGTWLAEQGV